MDSNAYKQCRNNNNNSSNGVAVNSSNKERGSVMNRPATELDEVDKQMVTIRD